MVCSGLFGTGIEVREGGGRRKGRGGEGRIVNALTTGGESFDIGCLRAANEFSSLMRRPEASHEHQQ